MAPASAAMAGQQSGQPGEQQCLFSRGVWRRRRHFHDLDRLCWSGHQRGQQIHAIFNVVVLGVKEDLDQIRIALRVGERAKARAEEKGLASMLGSSRCSAALARCTKTGSLPPSGQWVLRRAMSPSRPGAGTGAQPVVHEWQADARASACTL